MSKNNSTKKYLHRNVPVVKPDQSLGDITDSVISNSSSYESIDYIYVVDEKKQLKGVFSMKELLFNDKSSQVKDIMQKDVRFSRLKDTPQSIAIKSLKYNIRSVPIVKNDSKEFLGIVHYYNLMDILYSEANKDLLSLGGIYHSSKNGNDVFDSSIINSVSHRLPWLILGLFGGVFVAGIISSFELILSENLILAAYIPLLVYMSDAIGTQMEAYIIRDLSLNPKLDFKRYFKRQLLITILIGLIVSILILLFNTIFYHDPNIGFVIGISLLLASISSVFTGLVIPYLFERLHYDPANASGPIATIIQDMLTIFIYFTVATLLLV